MSLINDALKRAKQAHERKEQPTMRGAPLHTVMPSPERTNLTPVVVAVALLVLLLVGGGIFLLLQLNSSRQPAQVATAPSPAMQIATSQQPDISEDARPTQPTPAVPVATTPRQTQPTEAAPLPAPTPKPTPTAPLPDPVQQTPATVQPTPAVAVPPPAPALPPMSNFPEVRLQGILYQPGRPAAIINGRTLFIGGRVADATVVAITPENATLTWRGLTNVLTLPQ